MSFAPPMPSTGQLSAAGACQVELHSRACTAREQSFGNRVFIRGVVEISNYCRENCSYCGMRRDNRELPRFRATAEALATHVLATRPPWVTDLNLQAGEDPVAVREIALPLLRRLRQETDVRLSVGLGSLDHATYDALRDAGATVYIIKFETGNADHYRQISAPGTLAERIAHIRWLAAHGWHVSSGFIAGLPGQSPADLIANFQLAAELPLKGCSVSPFIPGDQTPLAGAAAGDASLALNAIASLRLLRPDWVIPAVSALNLDTAAPGQGLRRGLRAGANLLTMNLTPPELRADYLIYKRNRFIVEAEAILEALNAEGMEPSPVSMADHFASRDPGDQPGAGTGAGPAGHAG